MAKIEVTQFLRPNGRQRPMQVEVSDEAFVKAETIRRLGGKLTAEELMTGEVSLCIGEPNLGDFNIEVVPNGPEVIKALERMLLAFEVDDWKSYITEVAEGE